MSQRISPQLNCNILLATGLEERALVGKAWENDKGA